MIWAQQKLHFLHVYPRYPLFTFWRQLQDLMVFMKEIAVNSTWFFRDILHRAGAISVVLALDLGLAGSVNSQREATWSSIFGYYGELSGFSS